jgi:F-type H+-transporting ATPase subunit delta
MPSNDLPHCDNIAHQPIAKVYARALQGATDRFDAVLAELDALVNELFPRVPGFEAVLASPRVSVKDKLHLIDKTLDRRVSPELLRFIKVVCRHGRLDCLRAMYREARRLHNQSRGVVEVKFVTAQPVSHQMLAEARQALEAKLQGGVELQASADPTLIGGVLLRIGDRVYDGSVAHRLAALREQAVANTVHQMRERGERFAIS